MHPCYMLLQQYPWARHFIIWRSSRGCGAFGTIRLGGFVTFRLGTVFTFRFGMSRFTLRFATCWIPPDSSETVVLLTNSGAAFAPGIVVRRQQPRTNAAALKMALFISILFVSEWMLLFGSWSRIHIAVISGPTCQVTKIKSDAFWPNKIPFPGV